MSAVIDLAAQIRCVKREIAFRERVFQRQVASGRMKAQTADYEISAMRAVLATLTDLAPTSDETEPTLFQTSPTAKTKERA